MQIDFKFLYAFRGLIAFVAFTDLGVAVKAFVERKCILNEFMLDMSPLPRVYGFYAIMQAVILIHCTLFIHYKPLTSVGVCTLLLSIIMCVAESMLFQTMVFDFHIIFPCILNGITAIGLIVILISDIEEPKDEEDENTMLLRKINMTCKKGTWNEKVK